MSPCPATATLELLLAGALPGPCPFGDAVREHVRECSRCQAVLDELTDNPMLRRAADDLGTLAPLSAEDAGLHRVLEQMRLTPPIPPADETPTEAPNRADAPVEPAGDTEMVGPYRIRAALGHGGMGRVFRADDPVLQRTVALKVLRPEAADAKARARFVHEAQAAARINHDHVVRVHAVVNPPHGVPYLVMEYLAGPTLAELIRAPQGLEPRMATVIVAQVAEGLAAVHAAGLIHRDIKPSNIMLEAPYAPAAARGDWNGRAKLMDFGLARAGARASQLTQEGVVAGTPTYMSPEQAQGLEPLDARSDIYSLGMTLYEALTGDVPFRGAVHLVLRQVIQEEPRPPRRLNDKIPRDLETICLKCLAKEPAKRYASAAALAADLRSFLAGRPIQARPVRLWERGLKWARRRPAVAASLAAVLTLLVAVIGTLAASLELVHREKDRAETARRKTRDILDEMTARLLRRAGLAAPGRTRDALDQTASRVFDEFLVGPQLLDEGQKAILAKILTWYEELANESGNTPDARNDMARAVSWVATIQGKLGRAQEAEASFRRSLDLFDRLAADFPAVPDYRRDLALSYYHLAFLFQKTGRPRQAEAAFRDGCAGFERLTADFPAEPDYRYHLAVGQTNLGQILIWSGRGAEAAAVVRQAHADLLQLAADFRTTVTYHRGLIDSYHGAFLLAASPREGEALCREALDRFGRWADQSRDEPVYREALAYSFFDLGLTLMGTNPNGEAESALQKALRLFKKMAGDFPAATDYPWKQAYCLRNLGTLYMNSGRYDKAEEAFQSARGLLQQLVDSCPTVPAFREDLAGTHHQLGSLWKRVAGRLPEAEAAFREAGARWQRLAAEFPDNVLYRQSLAICQFQLSQFFLQSGRYPDAKTALESARATYQTLVNDFPTVAAYRVGLAYSHTNLGHVLHKTGGLSPEVETAFREALALYRKLAADFPDVREYRAGFTTSLINLGTLLAHTGRPQEAEPVFREAISYFEPFVRDFPNDPMQVQFGRTLNSLAEIVRQRADLVQARQLLDRARRHAEAALAASADNSHFRQVLRDNAYQRADVAAALGDHVAAAAAAGELSRLGFEPVRDSYKAVCILARCVALAGKDDQLGEDKRRELAESYTEQAWGVLGHAVAKAVGISPR